MVIDLLVTIIRHSHLSIVNTSQKVICLVFQKNIMANLGNHVSMLENVWTPLDSYMTIMETLIADLGEVYRLF